MTTAANISAKVAKGFAIAAAQAGVPFNWYRPTDPLAPIGTASLLGTTQAYVTATNTAPTTSGKDLKLEDWVGQLDVSQVVPGDILIALAAPANGAGFATGTTFYVGAIDPLLPARMVRCNALATISDEPTIATLGATTTYGGDDRGDDTPVAVGWPCAVSQGTKGELGDVKLPSDVRQPWINVLFPLMPGVNLSNNLRLAVTGESDAYAGTYVLSSTIPTWQGWRCTAVLTTS